MPTKDNDAVADRRNAALRATSTNVALTMLHRGRFLEDELKRALDHVRMSNEFLEKYTELLDSIDEECGGGKDSAGLQSQAADRVKALVKGLGRRDEKKDHGHDSAEELETSAMHNEKDELDEASPAT